MATDTHPERETLSATAGIDYREAEGLEDPTAAPTGDGRAWRDWMMVATGLAGLVAVLAVIVSVFAFASSRGSGETTTVVKRTTAATTGAAAATKAPTLADAKGVKFERFAKVDPTLPAV